MVDAHALGACGLGRAGSNPASPTNKLESETLIANAGGIAPITAVLVCVGRGKVLSGPSP